MVEQGMIQRIQCELAKRQREGGAEVEAEAEIDKVVDINCVDSVIFSYYMKYRRKIATAENYRIRHSNIWCTWRRRANISVHVMNASVLPQQRRPISPVALDFSQLANIECQPL
jgi:hypothetical protein